MPAQILGPAFAVGVPALLGIAFLIWCKRTMEGKDAAIVVVNRRTMNLALRRIAQAAKADDIARVAAGLTAVSWWLAHEIATGPRRRRQEYTTLKALVDKALAVARDALVAKVGVQ